MSMTTLPALTDTELRARRAAGRHYAAQYRQNQPEKRKACLLRYYVKQLQAAGYIVTSATTTESAQTAF